MRRDGRRLVSAASASRHLTRLADLLGFEYVPLDRLLACADVISLHLPDNPHSRYLLDRPQFERAKDSCAT